MRIEAQCRNFKFWLTLTKNENKLSQIAYNDIKWNGNKAFWSKKNQKLVGTDTGKENSGLKHTMRT